MGRKLNGRIGNNPGQGGGIATVEGEKTLFQVSEANKLYGGFEGIASRWIYFKIPIFKIKLFEKPWKLIFVLSSGAIVVFAMAPAIAPAARLGKTVVNVRRAVGSTCEIETFNKLFLIEKTLFSVSTFIFSASPMTTEHVQ